jgi:hypothetical protein
MEIHFEEPESKIIVQNAEITENDYMFFIERGECQVKINDKIK